VRDGIHFTQAGQPTVVFVHDFFEAAAKAGARALGLPELKLYVFPQNKAGTTEAEEIEKGRQAARALPRLLGGAA